MILGIVKDVTDPINIKIQAKEPLPLGKYVTIERDDDKCLGLVETSLSSSSAISNITNFQEAIEKEVSTQRNNLNAIYGALQQTEKLYKLSKGESTDGKKV